MELGDGGIAELLRDYHRGGGVAERARDYRMLLDYPPHTVFDHGLTITSQTFDVGSRSWAERHRKEEDKLALKDLNEGKKHRTGCLYSDQPKTIIAGRTQFTTNPITTTTIANLVDTPTDRARDNITTCIFFKHCDGVFKNIQGQRLPIRTQVEEALERRKAKAEAKRKKERDWCEVWLNNAVQELMMIWGKDEEGVRRLLLKHIPKMSAASWRCGCAPKTRRNFSFSTKWRRLIPRELTHRDTEVACGRSRERQSEEVTKTCHMHQASIKISYA